MVDVMVYFGMKEMQHRIYLSPQSDTCNVQGEQDKGVANILKEEEVRMF